MGEERFSVRLIEYVDGTTSSELTGNPTSTEVVGIIEMYRAIQRLLIINAFSDAHNAATKVKTTSKTKKSKRGLSK